MRTIAPSVVRIKHDLHRLRTVIAKEDGSAVVEFALLSPILLLMTLATFDLGTAISERMAIDGALRNGLHAAMAGNDTDETLAIIQSSAESRIGAGSALYSVSEFCTCGTPSDSVVQCTTACSGGGIPNVFWGIQASYSHNSWFLPDIAMEPGLILQLR